MGKALTLMYHDVVPSGCFSQSGFCTIGADHYKLTEDQFQEHLTAITAAIGTNAGLVTDDASQASLFFTMDDGGASSLYVADQLERRGWRGHFFITTNYIGARGFLNAAELRQLAKRGHCIGSHTCSHPMPMWDCAPEQMYAEWHASRQKLESIVGEAVTCGSVPGGAYALPIAAAAAKAGYQNLFTSEPTSAVHYVEGCRVLGRFGVLRTTTAADAAKLATGDLFACSKQQALWNTKKVLKKVAAKPYAAARGFLMQRRYADGATLAAPGTPAPEAQSVTEPLTKEMPSPAPISKTAAHD
jgi:peptidoglycan/xylan/chitin deacetylase (PgdA/CDA1 family)